MDNHEFIKNELKAMIEFSKDKTLPLKCRIKLKASLDETFEDIDKMIIDYSPKIKKESIR